MCKVPLPYNMTLSQALEIRILTSWEWEIYYSFYVWIQMWCIPAAPLQIQFPVNNLGKAAKDAPTVWTPDNHVGNSDEAPPFGLAQLWPCDYLGCELVRGGCLSCSVSYASLQPRLQNQWIKLTTVFKKVS